MSLHRRLITIAVSLWCALAFTILAVSLYLLATGHASAATQDDVEREIVGAFERSEWTRQERRAFALSVIGHAIDHGRHGGTHGSTRIRRHRSLMAKGGAA